MLFIIIIIYLIFICLYIYAKTKKNSKIIVYNNGQLIIQIIFIMCFFLFFFITLRILNIFRNTKILDLNSFTFDIKFFLLLIFLYNLRKLIFYRFKISWFKFHYVMMCETNFGIKVANFYKFIYYNIIYLPAYYTLKYTMYLNYIMILGLITIFFYDFFLNNLVLNYSLIYLKYYSLFKIIYISHNFMIIKQNLILDYYSYNLLYPGNIDKSYFMNYIDEQHKNLKEESKKYVNSIILEKEKHEKKNIPSVNEINFFKNI